MKTSLGYISSISLLLLFSSFVINDILTRVILTRDITKKRVLRDNNKFLSNKTNQKESEKISLKTKDAKKERIHFILVKPIHEKNSNLDFRRDQII